MASEQITFTSKRKPGSFEQKENKKKNENPSKVDCKPEDNKAKNLVPENYPFVPKLKEFDPKEDKPPKGFFIICEGSRRCGKSEFLRWFLQFYKDFFQLAIVCTETPHNGFWQPFVGNKWVHFGWDPYMVQKLLDEQKKDIEKEKVEHGFKAKQVLIVLDDIIGDRKRIHDDRTLGELATEGRHSNISVCITTQEPCAIGTALRNNADIVVIFQQKSKRAKKSVVEDFLLFKLDYDWQARDLLKTYTNNHDCIILKMWVLRAGCADAYRYLPETTTWDCEKDKPKTKEYQLGCKEQQKLAQSKLGRLPLT